LGNFDLGSEDVAAIAMAIVSSLKQKHSPALNTSISRDTQADLMASEVTPSRARRNC
jgi:hypothetical protein